MCSKAKGKPQKNRETIRSCLSSPEQICCFVLESQTDAKIKMGVAQNEATGVTRVLVYLSIYQGSILDPPFLSHTQMGGGRDVPKPQKPGVRYYAFVAEKQVQTATGVSETFRFF